jgi:hypothetical protein
MTENKMFGRIVRRPRFVATIFAVAVAFALSLLLVHNGGGPRSTTLIDAQGATSIGAAGSTTSTTWPYYQLCAPNTPQSLISTVCVPKTNASQWPQSDTQAAPAVSATRALAIANAMTVSSSLTADAAQSPTVTETTYSNAAAMLKEGANANVPPDTEVWVVTVPRAFGMESEPPGDSVTIPQNDTTVVIDAANGNPIDACAGCIPLG